MKILHSGVAYMLSVLRADSNFAAPKSRAAASWLFPEAVLPFRPPSLRHWFCSHVSTVTAIRIYGHLFGRTVFCGSPVNFLGSCFPASVSPLRHCDLGVLMIPVIYAGLGDERVTADRAWNNVWSSVWSWSRFFPQHRTYQWENSRLLVPQCYWAESRLSIQGKLRLFHHQLVY